MTQASVSTCLECGAARDPLDVRCPHCGRAETSEPGWTDRAGRVLRRARALVNLTLAVEDELAEKDGLSVGYRHLLFAVVGAAAVSIGRVMAVRAPPEDQLIAWAFVTAAILGPFVVLVQGVSHYLPAKPRRVCECTSTSICLGCLVHLDMAPPDWLARAEAVVPPDTSLGACPRCGGEGELREGHAWCRHCRAPLLPSPELLQQAEQRQQERAYVLRMASGVAAKRRYERAERLATWAERGKKLLALAAYGWVILAVLKGL